jgi:hypothetical protein
MNFGKVKLKLSPVHAVRAHGGEEAKLLLILTSALDGGE